jgi:urate oxidase
VASDLSRDSYGSARVRLVRVGRHPDRHDLKELTVDLRFAGEFESALFSTETISNAIYGLAKNDEAEQPEDFAGRLLDYFSENYPEAREIHVEIAERPWARALSGGRPQPFTFSAAGGERRLASVHRREGDTAVQAGLRNLVLARTLNLELEEFRADAFAPVAPAPQSVMEADLTAVWTYSGSEVAYGPCWHGVRQLIVDTFVQHRSGSAQHLLHAVAEAILASFDEIRETDLSMTARQWPLVNLEPFGMENRNEVFAPAAEPETVLRAVLKRA